MNVLYVVSESRPFIATGGLAEVAGSLPIELKKLGVNIKVIMPLYKEIIKNFNNDLVFVGETTIKLSWRKQYCGLYMSLHNGVEYYFVDNKFYFDRDELYSHYDDGERFAFFSLAIFDCLNIMKFHPQIIHCNDHQTALVPVYLDLMKKEGKMLDVKSIFTIHNIEYQGIYDPIILGDVLGIDEQYEEILLYNYQLNLMKGAIVTADLITTVSPRYAREITTAAFASGLHYITNTNRQKLIGILNGIDYDYYNPATDDIILNKYDFSTIDKKLLNKKATQKAFNLTVDESKPLFAIISRLATHKGIDLIIDKVDELMKTEAQLIVLGVGEFFYEEKFKQFMKKYPNRISALITFDANLAKQLYSSVDFLLMPSKTEPCGLSQMIACRYGTIPIVRATGGLYDTINNNNGFIFGEYNSDELIEKIKEAINVYKDRNKYLQLVENAMASDYTWTKSANQYYKEYQKLL